MLKVKAINVLIKLVFKSRITIKVPIKLKIKDALIFDTCELVWIWWWAYFFCWLQTAIYKPCICFARRNNQKAVTIVSGAAR